VGLQFGLVVGEQVLALAHKQAEHLRVEMLQFNEQVFLQGIKGPKWKLVYES
jgi:hypothetical protein